MESSKSVIKEIYILNGSGIGVFYQNYEDQVQKDLQLIAPFFSAIQSFAQECTKDNLKALIMGENKYSFINHETFSIVIKTDKSLDLKNIQKKIDNLSRTFFTQYGKELMKSNQDLDNYNNFEIVVREMFEVKIRPTFKSSELVKDFLGLSDRNVNFKKVINSL